MSRSLRNLEWGSWLTPTSQRAPVRCPLCVAYHLWLHTIAIFIPIVISSAAGSSANADDPAKLRNPLFRGCPILNFAFFAKFRVGMLEADPNQHRTSIIVAAELRYGADKRGSPRLSSQSDAVLGRVAQVRARPLHIQARNTRFPGADLGFAIFRRDSPRCHSCRSSCVIRPTQPRSLRFPFREPSSGPIHFPLDLVPSPRYYITTQVIFEIKMTAFFDNLTRAQLLAIANY